MDDELIYRQLEDIRTRMERIENNLSDKQDNLNKRVSRIEGYIKGIIIMLTVGLPLTVGVLFAHPFGL